MNQINQIEKILQLEKSLSNKLDILLNSDNILTYSAENYRKINKNAMHQSNLIIEKYEDSLINVSTLIQSTIEKLEDSKCILKINLDFKEENKNLNYRIEMLALDVLKH